MEVRVKDSTNICPCGDKHLVKAYCQRCKIYVCEDCQVMKHLDHEQDIIDLAEKCTRYLADYQKLSRAASLMSDRRQVHIKDESIEKIIEEIKQKIIETKENLQKDIVKSTDSTLQYMVNSPLIQEMIHKKAELSSEADDALTKLKKELIKVCSDLLTYISDNKLESADRLLTQKKLEEYEEEVKKATKASSNDYDFIQEVRKLKQTSVDYAYNPMALLGMIKVNSQIKRPNRIFQFDREMNVLSIFNIDTKRLISTKLSIGFILPFRFVTADVNGNLLLCGGDNDHGIFLKSLFIFDELRGCLIKLADMKEARSRHTLVGIDDKQLLYSIAGENSNGVLKSCEFYDINENAWKEAPSLNHPRCSSSACLLTGKKIIVLGGWDQEYLANIEQLDYADGKEWEIVKFGKKQNLKPLQYPGIFEIKESELMIFGGCDENGELSIESYLLNFDSHSIKHASKIGEVGETFITSEGKKFGQEFYSFGYTNGGIYIYNIEKEEWIFIEQNKIPH